MKPSQRQPKEVRSPSHLTQASSTFADSVSTIFDINHDGTTTDASDISNLINASHVSHAIASSYHALTTQALRQHNKHFSSLPRSSIDLNTTRAQHASQAHASLDELFVELPTHLRSNALQGYVGGTPIAYFETHPGSRYQQLDNYHDPADLQSSKTPLQATPQGLREHDNSMIAEFGTQGQSQGGSTYWVPDRERYIHARITGRDITDWGEDLSGVGTHFDAQGLAEEADPNSTVG